MRHHHDLAVSKDDTENKANMKTNLVGITLFALSSSAKTFSKIPQSKTSLSRLSMSSSATSGSFYSLSGVASDGSTIAASDFQGKVVFATNVASI